MGPLGRRDLDRMGAVESLCGWFSTLVLVKFCKIEASCLLFKALHNDLDAGRGQKYVKKKSAHSLSKIGAVEIIPSSHVLFIKEGETRYFSKAICIK